MVQVVEKLGYHEGGVEIKMMRGGSDCGETTGPTDRAARSVQEENVPCADRGCRVWERKRPLPTERKGRVDCWVLFSRQEA